MANRKKGGIERSKRMHENGISNPTFMGDARSSQKLLIWEPRTSNQQFGVSEDERLYEGLTR
ncbi:hypothetical protein D4R75_16165 [bacterium]|nr:MAG: hypothetical protein D4R75_16165 [bacterium]